MKKEKTIIREQWILVGLAILVILGFSGCSSNEGETTELQQQNAMGFAACLAEDESTAGARETRTTPAPGDGEFTTEQLKSVGFGVYCWYTGSQIVPNTLTGEDHIKNYTTTILMRNQRVEWKNSNWTYAPTKYWPLDTDERLTLRAYAPYVSYDLQTDAHGMPMLPVVVKADDYQNGTQHDPLWGTSKHEGTTDAEDATTKNEVYGKLYNNYTYQMSGIKLAEDGKDGKDGIIEWYFHHGMTKLIFACKLIASPGCEKVVIRGINITPLYDKGLLDISSSAATANYPDKPYWDTSAASDMTVNIGEEYLNLTAAGKLEVRANDDPSQESEAVNILSQGLLIIPRTFTGSDKMTITVSYTIDNDGIENKQDAKAEITPTFYGNTVYTINLKLTPATNGLDITMVQSAFTPWKDGGTGDHEVYNW